MVTKVSAAEKPIMIDLFCGAGGTSTGLLEAAGDLGDIVKQIGNAVPVNLAKALAKTILSSSEKKASR